MRAVLSTEAGSDTPGLGRRNLSTRLQYDDSDPGGFPPLRASVDVTCRSYAACSSALRWGANHVASALETATSQFENSVVSQRVREIKTPPPNEFLAHPRVL